MHMPKEFLISALEGACGTSHHGAVTPTMHQDAHQPMRSLDTAAAMYDAVTSR